MCCCWWFLLAFCFVDFISYFLNVLLFHLCWVEAKYVESCFAIFIVVKFNCMWQLCFVPWTNKEHLLLLTSLLTGTYSLLVNLFVYFIISFFLSFASWLSVRGDESCHGCLGVMEKPSSPSPPNRNKPSSAEVSLAAEFLSKHSAQVVCTQFYTVLHCQYFASNLDMFSFSCGNAVIDI